nr:ABC transporter ATP-binding protein [Chloroflexota bacterium]
VQRFFTEGVARYLAHRVESPAFRKAGPGARDPGPHTPEPAPTLAAERRCRDAAAANKWRLPLYQSMIRGPGPDIDPGLYAAMQEVFGGYVFERDGAKEFLRFLNAVREDPNRAAEVAYGESLELIEAEWLAGLRRGLGRKLVSLWEFLRQVWPYLKPYPWRQVELICLILISSFAVQVAPFQVRILYDLLVSDQAKADPWGYGLPGAMYSLMLLSIATLVNICAVARLVYVVAVLGQNILRDLRMAYIARVNSLGAGYFARMRTGDIMARFTSDMSRMADPMARTIGYSLFYMVLIPITLVSLIYMSWQLTLLLLIVVPTYLVISRALGPKIQRANRSRQERLAQINSHLEEMVYAHPMVQIFNLQDFFRRRMSPEVHQFRRVEVRSDFLRAVFEEVNDLADLTVTRIVLIGGAVLVLAAYDPSVAAAIGSISIGTLTGFNLLMARFITPVHRLANIYASVSLAAAPLRRVEEILRQEPEMMDTPPGGTAEPPAVREGISIEGVDFAYGSEPTLRDINVTIPAGTSAAFVGPTGAGKTTLVNMIPRFYDPASGVVKIDGRDVQEHALPALRSQVALVSQENPLFNTTIRENIALGKLDATDEEVVAAAKAARIHEFVMSLPAGYDTIIGERGGRLSGGQRQRLAIARALLRDAPILILDEATSALDAETEHEILQELDEVTRGKTTISITHRLALAMRADTIYVLDQGRVVESGSHDELMAHHSLYRKLFEDQNEFLLKTGLVPGPAPSDGAEAANGAAARPATASGA